MSNPTLAELAYADNIALQHIVKSIVLGIFKAIPKDKALESIHQSKDERIGELAKITFPGVDPKDAEQMRKLVLAAVRSWFDDLIENLEKPPER